MLILSERLSRNSPFPSQAIKRSPSLRSSKTWKRISVCRDFFRAMSVQGKLLWHFSRSFTGYRELADKSPIWHRRLSSRHKWQKNSPNFSNHMASAQHSCSEASRQKKKRKSNQHSSQESSPSWLARTHSYPRIRISVISRMSSSMSSTDLAWNNEKSSQNISVNESSNRA